MALARLKRKIEHTEGEGNCAFHAFALALCNRQVFSQIERSVYAAHTEPDVRFAGFIKRVAGKLNVNPRWRSVTRALLALREEDSRELQFILAPILRELSINIARDPADSAYHTLQTVEPMMGAFDAYCRNKSDDDIFIKHNFIKMKFDEVSRTEMDEVMREKMLNQWWWSEGYDQFLVEMGKDGQWAGDLELARLARYFNVVVDGVKLEQGVENPVPIYGNYGYFPYLHGAMGSKVTKNQIADVMKCLYDRDILNREDSNNKGVAFNVSSLFLLKDRLGKVHAYDEIIEFLMHQENLKGQPLPKEWTSNLMIIAQLSQRNVIGRAKDGVSYIFSVDVGEAMLRIGEVPCYDVVKQICLESYEEHARLVLYNDRAYHWANTVPEFIPPKALIGRQGFFDAAQSVLATYSPEPANGLRSSGNSVRRFT